MISGPPVCSFLLPPAKDYLLVTLALEGWKTAYSVLTFFKLSLKITSEHLLYAVQASRCLTAEL